MIHVSSYPTEMIEIIRNYKFTNRFNITNETKFSLNLIILLIIKK